MKKKHDPGREEREQYEANGKYAYEYHSPAEPNKHGRRDADPEDEVAPLTPPWTTNVPGPPPPKAPGERAKAHSRTTTNRLIFVLAVMVVAILVAQNTIFRLTTVYVIGYRNKTPQQIAAASGLVKGLNMFSLSEDEVRENLSSDHTIVFLGMQKDYPSTIYLYISEREPVASLQWLGLL
ncbi:MAG: FtsQ-type POTRA domain-containing protein, partial [Eubacteriales bacterium]|nr:FtsQ-type POTRA domain-containing protein [Eubacteriales bacterium]